MKRISTEGPTIICIRTIYGTTYTLSVMSERGAFFAAHRSSLGLWDHPVTFYMGSFVVDGFRVLGFQPSTGRHIAIRDNR